MVVLYFGSKISKSLILYGAVILVWAHLQGRERLTVESVWDLGQRYFYSFFVVQMLYAVLWEQYFSLINHIAENGKHMITKQTKERKWIYGKLASVKTFIGPRSMFRKKKIYYD